MWTLKPYGAGRHGLATVEGSDSFGGEGRVVFVCFRETQAKFRGGDPLVICRSPFF